MARVDPRERAQARALRGEVETAGSEFSELLSQGDRSAHAALAEFAAYQANWAAVLEHAREIITHPDSVATYNVYTDMLKLLGVYGVSSGDWGATLEATKAALAVLSPKYETYQREVSGLASFATAKGGRESEWRPGVYDKDTGAEGAARWDAAMVKVAKMKFKTPEMRLQHCFSIARTYNYKPAAITLYEQGGPPQLFDTVVFLASALARVGRQEEAWGELRAKLHLWWPVEETQVAPVSLLADEALRPLMTPERRDEVLRTVRGPEAHASPR